MCGRIYPVMNRIKFIVERNDTRLGRVFDLGIQGLILVSFSVETLEGLSVGGIFLSPRWGNGIVLSH